MAGSPQLLLRKTNIYNSTLKSIAHNVKLDLSNNQILASSLLTVVFPDLTVMKITVRTSYDWLPKK